MVDRYFVRLLRSLQPTPEVKTAAKSAIQHAVPRLVDHIKAKYTLTVAAEQQRTQGNHQSSVKQFIVKLKKEKTERLKRGEQLKATAEKQLEQEKLQNIRAEEEQQIREQQEKRLRLHRMAEDSRRRREERKELRETGDRNYKQISYSVPLYRRLEENYANSAYVPPAKKLRHAPLANIREHLRKYLDGKALAGSSKKNAPHNSKRDFLRQLHKSTFHQSLVKRTHSETQSPHTRDLITKRRNYSNVVKELFSPPLKPLQLPCLEESQSPRRPAQSLVIPKRTWKKNPLVPDPPLKREPVFTDYLAMRRQFRESYVSRPLSLAPQQQLRQLRQLIIQQEAQLTPLHSSTPWHLHNSQKLNSLLLQSVRTKLSLLSSQHN